MRRGPGGHGPQLSSRGQVKEVEEGARRRRAPSLNEEGARRMRRGPQTPQEPTASPKRGQVWHLILCRLTQLLIGMRKKFLMKEMYEVFHTSYLKVGQCKTDKEAMVFGHMAIILFPVLCKYRKVLKRTKMTKIKCKDNKTTMRDVVGRT